MGLDISAYANLTKIENPQLDEGGNPDFESNLWRACSICYFDKHFPGRAEGLENDAVYAYTENIGFRAGSYGGYGHWRNQLAQLAGFEGDDDFWQNCKSGPFWELINFYDNEGIIGPVVAAKLAKDFADYHAKAKEVGEYFFDLYCLWQQAFEMAAQNGAVDFH